jgi:MFS family permease
MEPTKNLENVPPIQKHDRWQALRHRDFQLVLLSRFSASLGEQMIRVALGWEIYERTNDPFYLGLVGLVQVLPVILLSLFAGHVADRYNRKHIVIVTQAGLGLFSLGLAALSFTHGSLILIYLCLFMFGVMRAFNDPANSTLLAQSVPSEAFENAATWGSSAWQIASVVGPAFGGFLLAYFKSGAEIFLINAISCTIFATAVSFMKLRPIPQSKESPSVASLLAGFHFLRDSQILLAAITLDLFAVLFGGAVALLPVYAKDILNVGPAGLGWLQSAQSIGAITMAAIMIYIPPLQNAGKTLLFAVAGFGIATIIFGISSNFILSMAMLATLGALDHISVVIRSTLMLTRVPDEMRGRVAAVNTVFISSSNELGGFESGLVTRLGQSVFGTVGGPIFAVVSGGVATVLVVIAVTRKWPEMVRLGRLTD